MLVLDFGGQYSQLIARRVREARVYSELVAHRLRAAEVRARNPLALILSGGPASVYADGAPHVDPAIFELGVPTLGICYGMQLMAPRARRRRSSERRLRVRQGRASTLGESALFHDLPAEQAVWMSHRDSVTAAPAGARVTAVVAVDADRRVRGPGARGSTASSSTPRSCTRRTGQEILEELPLRRRRRAARPGRRPP